MTEESKDLMERMDKDLKEHMILVEKWRRTTSLILLLIVIVVAMSVLFWYDKISQQLYAAFMGVIMGATLLELILRRK